MLPVYLRLVIARVRARQVSTLLSLGVTAAAAAMLLIALVIRGSATAPFERLLDDAGGPHVILSSSSAERLEEAALLVSDLVRAEAFTGQLLGDGSLNAEGTTHPLQFWSLDRPDISGAGEILEGRWLDGPREAVLDAGLAEEAGIAPGETVALAGPGGLQRVTVVGTAVVTTRPGYPIWDPASVFIGSDTMEQLRGGEELRFVTGLRLEDAAQTEQAMSRLIENGAAGPGGAINLSVWTAARDAIEDQITGNVLVLQTFGAFALVASALIVGNLAAARLVADRRDIGLLKALGFTPAEVGGLYLLEFMAVAAVAGAAGVGLAYVLAPVFLSPITQLLHTSPEVTVPPGGVAVVLTAVVGLAALSALVPALQAGRLGTVSALQPQIGTSSRPPRLALAAVVLRAPLSVRLGLSDTFARPVRAWITVLAVGTLGASVAATLTFSATVDGFVEHPERTGIPPYDLVVAPIGDGRAETLDALRQWAVDQPEVRATVTLGDERVDLPVTGRASQALERLLVRSLGGDLSDSGIPVTEGRLPEAPGEAAVGLGLSTGRGIGVGDRLETRLVLGDSQSPMPLTVVGIVVEHSNNGRVLLVTHGTIAAAGGDSEPAAVAFRLTPGSSAEALSDQITQLFGNAVQIDLMRARLIEDTVAVRDQLMPVMLALNALLVLIATVNLALILIITMGERKRDLSTLRALGFTPSQVASSVVTSAAFLGVLGVVLGGPTGYFVVRWLLGGVAQDEGWPASVIEGPEPLGWVALGLLALGLAGVAAAVPSWTASSRPVMEGLRSE